MSTVVIMPRQGQSVESCVIAKWHKKKGDQVSEGDTLFTYETDKATFDEEAKTEGVLLELFFEEGDDVTCLTNVCVIGTPGEDISAFIPQALDAESSGKPDTASKATEKTGAIPEDSEKQNAITQTSVQTGFLKISPRARALVEKTGADVAYAVPSGANGRIMSRDIEHVVAEGRLVTPAARSAHTPGSGITGTGIGGRITTADLKSGSSAAVSVNAPSSDQPEYDTVAVSGIRKVISNAMYSSLMGSAQLTLNSSFDATDILEFRKRLKESTLSLPAVSITDIIVYVTARVLLRHKNLNAHYLDDKIHIYNTTHMGVATDTPRGLIVPTVFNAERLTLAELSSRAKELVTMCREGSISPDLITGGTFTVSNLGAFGIESFTPILNPPQTGLLGVCSIIERSRNGKIYPAMGLSLTFDHRALDGADAARFLKELVENLENFSLTAALY